MQPSANEYKISEKIKEANQELYAQSNISNLANRRVRFREQLEDFEPEDSVEIEESVKASNRVQEIDNISEVSSDDGYGESNNSDFQMGDVQIEEIEEILSTKSELESEDMSEICEQLDEELSIKSEILPKQAFYEEKKLEVYKKERRRSGSAEPYYQEPEEPTGVQLCFPKKYKPRSSKVKPVPGHDPNRPRKIKDCCQQKTSEEYLNKLPKYKGAISEYGLSTMELEQKFLKEQKSFHLKQMKEYQKHQEKEIIAQTNEDAFRKWLFEKMRHPINKSKNMFDVKYSKYIMKYRRRKEPTRKNSSQPKTTPENELNDQIEELRKNEIKEIEESKSRRDSQTLERQQELIEQDYLENEDGDLANQEMEDDDEEEESGDEIDGPLDLEDENNE